jgi:hypothetical protein
VKRVGLAGLAAVIGLGLFGSTGTIAKMPTYLTCRGVLVHEDGEYQLKPDTGSSLWCDADISDEFGLKGSVSRVLDTCKLGGRCEIEGVVNGHGAFYWVKLSSVRSLSSPSTTAELPNRFWGAWIDAGDNPMKMTVTADGMLFGTSPPACKFTNIKVANEDGSAYEVNWHCPDSAPGVEIKMAFRLMRVRGKEVLVLVNTEEPTVVSVYERAH